MEEDLLLFFGSHMDALPIYRRLEACILSQIPDVRLKIQKSQISFYNRHMFACVSFLRVKKKKELPDPYLVVTLGMPYPLESPRVAVKTEPYPGRWTTHIVIGEMEEIDGELLSWLKEAHDFAKNK